MAAGGAARIVGPGKAWAVEFDALEPEPARTLLSMTRALHPHERIEDAHHAKVARDLDVEASGDDEERLRMLRGGAQALDHAAGGDFSAVGDDAEEAALMRIAGAPFIEAVRSKLVSLHNQPGVWE